MKYIFGYNSEDGIVAYYSEEINESDMLEHIVIDLTPEEMDKLKLPYRLLIEEGKLVFEETDAMKAQREETERLDAKEDLISKCQDPNTKLSDLIPYLQKIL